MSVSVYVCRGRSGRREGKEVRREDGIGDGMGWDGMGVDGPGETGER
jgi:hypothetical protein